MYLHHPEQLGGVKIDMSHFAQIDNDGKVLQVIVVSNDDIKENTLSFPDTEPVGQKFIANTLLLPGEWRQTSYNGKFRGKYAGIGDRYDPDLDEFVSPEPNEPAATD